MTMSIHTRHLAAALLALMALAIGCSEDDPTAGTHIGNPGDLDFRATSALRAEDGAPASRDAKGEFYGLREARINLRDIELDLPDGVGCAELEGALVGASCEGDKIRVEGPLLIDLLEGSAQPSIAEVRIPPLTYKRVDYRIDDAEDLPDGHVLEDHSFYVAAGFERDGQPLELRILLKFNEDARVEAPIGVALPGGGRLTVNFDAAQWLSDVPIGDCLDDGDLEIDNGVVLVDEDSDCGEIEGTIKDNIKSSTALQSSDR